LNEGGRPIKTGTAPEPVIDDRPTLAQVGISKKLSARSQAIAAIPANEFEETLDEHREKQQAVTAATMEKLTKKGQQAAEGQTEKKGPMIPGAMAAAIHRLRTEIEICSAKGWARCDREEVRKEVRKIERMIQ
jgi:nitrate reductase cytochrome c-type subunit